MQNQSLSSQFITVEGQDGAGKSTNIQVIQDYLTERNIDFISTREPGGTELGEMLRETLLNTQDIKIGDMAELLMVFAARAQHIEQVIKPALSNGRWVLCDRFTDATYAYQGGGRGLPIEWIEQLEILVQQSLQPNLTLLLDVSVDVGVSRVGQRSEPDRFEKEKLDFKNKVRQCYLQSAETQANRIKLIDAADTLENVKTSIIASLDDFMQKTKITTPR